MSGRLYTTAMTYVHITEKKCESYGNWKAPKQSIKAGSISMCNVNCAYYSEIRMLLYDITPLSLHGSNIQTIAKNCRTV